MKEITSSIKENINFIESIYKHDKKISKMYENCIKNTFLKTLKPKENGKTFVITGDIAAMWLRDSAAQVRPLLLFAKDDPISQTEPEEILNLFKVTDADTYLMHEGVDVDSPYNFTRPWFSWANSLFAEFILSLNGIVIKGSPLAKYR